MQKINCIVIEFGCITLETAKELKTLTLPSKVNCLMRHNFQMFSVLKICSQKFLFCSIFLLYKK